MEKKFTLSEFVSENEGMMEVVATNISDYIVNFQDYSRFEGDKLEDCMNEFSVIWLEGYTELDEEYVVAFDCEVLFDGFKAESDAEQVYEWLNERAHELANEVENQKKVALLNEERHCNRCNKKVAKSELLEEYSYQCFECDEDLYSFETYVLDK